jgi:hypothetical protein
VLNGQLRTLRDACASDPECRAERDQIRKAQCLRIAVRWRAREHRPHEYAVDEKLDVGTARAARVTRAVGALLARGIREHLPVERQRRNREVGEVEREAVERAAMDAEVVIGDEGVVAAGCAVPPSELPSVGPVT